VIARFTMPYRRETKRAAVYGALSAIVFAAGLSHLRLLGSAHAAPTGRETVTLEQNRAYALEELTRLVREQTGAKVYADKRQEQRRVFVSQGTYELPALLWAVQSATGLPLRRVGETRFLSLPDRTLGGRLLFPLLPRKLLDRLGSALRPMAEKVDLRRQGIPFTAADFLARRDFAFRNLPRDRQAFVVKAVEYIRMRDTGKPGIGRMDIDEKLLKERTKDLQDARVRLGTSYLMVICPYSPSASPQQPDGKPFLSVTQVYYDYRDAFGVDLPED
jgi:hypothetical protein